MTIKLRACSHGGGGLRVCEVSHLDEVPTLFTQSLYLSCRVHMRGGAPHRGRLPGWPGRVIRFARVSFLHVKACEAGQPAQPG